MSNPSILVLTLRRQVDARRAASELLLGFRYIYTQNMHHYDTVFTFCPCLSSFTFTPDGLRAHREEARRVQQPGKREHTVRVGRQKGRAKDN